MVETGFDCRSKWAWTGVKSGARLHETSAPGAAGKSSPGLLPGASFYISLLEVKTCFKVLEFLKNFCWFRWLPNSFGDHHIEVCYSIFIKRTFVLSYLLDYWFVWHHLLDNWYVARNHTHVVMEPANSYLRCMWGPTVHGVFNIPVWFLIPLVDLEEYIWFLETESDPMIAKALHCGTVVDCGCYHCMEEEDMPGCTCGWCEWMSTRWSTGNTVIQLLVPVMSARGLPIICLP